MAATYHILEPLCGYGCGHGIGDIAGATHKPVTQSHQVFQRINFVPALMYVVVSAMFVDFLMPGPQMFANTLVILVLGRLFDIYKLQRCYAEIFDVGFLVAVASLFSLPAISLSLFLFIGLGSLRAFNIREYIIGLLGILTPYFLIITYYFWIDKLPDF